MPAISQGTANFSEFARTTGETVASAVTASGFQLVDHDWT
jgi:hypothetical protein